MKCSNCYGPLDETDCYCPTCGKKNPLVTPDAHAKVLFHLHFDEDIDVQPADIPQFTTKDTAYPTVSSGSAAAYSTPLNAQKSTGTASYSATTRPLGTATPAAQTSQNKSKGCSTAFVVIFIIVWVFVAIMSAID